MTDPVDLRQYRQARVSDPRVVLERLLAPEILQALDVYVREVAEEVAARQLKPWLTVAEAAAELGCSEAAVRKRHARGRLAGRYQGSRLYIDSRSLMPPSGYAAPTTQQVAPARRTSPGARTRKDQLS